MKLEFIQGDSLEVTDDTPMYNPQGLLVKMEASKTIKAVLSQYACQELILSTLAYDRTKLD